MTDEHTAQTSQAATAVEWMCPNCGDEVDNGTECEPWDCVYCGETMVPKDRSDVTPNERLRELIDNWRENGIPIHQQNPDPSQSAGQKAANQLEELVEDG